MGYVDRSGEVGKNIIPPSVGAPKKAKAKETQPETRPKAIAKPRFPGANAKTSSEFVEAFFKGPKLSQAAKKLIASLPNKGSDKGKGIDTKA